MNKLGLLGKNISYSFSRAYFKEKFQTEHIENTSYENFDIENINKFQDIIKHTEGLRGLNVTIPYKEAVMPYLDEINEQAKAIGAVNTIRITKKGKLVGYNTDCYGFKKTIEPFIKPHHKKALILGTGGASKAVIYSLKELGLTCNYVSRNLSKNVQFSYDTLTKEDVKNHEVIVNCTPLGTFPDIKDCPNIPYDGITEKHLLFDLIYNPEETTFLSSGKKNGATIVNGANMLKLQAEKSWSIWDL
ncbi:shikimate dehydrogenase [Tamlana agarivorans]|uniref:Shikimate dehydrogenase n=1 Tax=Pseudotamlana agarivorans TaxID=481183 RepID=A0ACC5UAV0_9FLAO|nr:shikimate dehydrogenase [Tamlana agarivorans]MBU2951425.1 shikimate dehydrogenase [Tamlana agarivorans]